MLTKVAWLMDEFLETIEIMKDKKLVKDSKIALRKVEEGKADPLDGLLRELNLESEI